MTDSARRGIGSRTKRPHSPDPVPTRHDTRNPRIPHQQSSRRAPQWPSLVLKPESRGISQEQLAAEVKSIYTGLTMVERACTLSDQTQARLVTGDEWQAMIALHRTLLHERHDFFLATQPSATPLERPVAHKCEPSHTGEHNTSEVGKARRFACWVCKRYGQSGSKGAACEGRGFNTVHRGKEHCYRRHAPHHQCPRCHETFDSADDVDQHLSSTVACEKRTALNSQPANVLSWKQLRDIKHKRKQKTTDFDEWNRIYKVLFPDQTVIPSPYVGEDEDEHGVNPYFQAYVRQELSNELHILFDNATTKNLRDPNFKRMKIQEALDQVTARYRKRRLRMHVDGENLSEPHDGSKGEPSFAETMNTQSSDHSDAAQHQELGIGTRSSTSAGATTSGDALHISLTNSNVDNDRHHQTGLEASGAGSRNARDSAGSAAVVDESLDFLSQFDTAYLIDSHECVDVDAWKSSAAALGTILPINFLDAGNLDLYFQNASDGPRWVSDETHASMDELLRAFSPKSKVMARAQHEKGIDERLRDVIESYLKRYHEEHVRNSTPLNVVIFTTSRPKSSVDVVIAETTGRLAELGINMSKINVQIFLLPSNIEEDLPKGNDANVTATPPFNLTASATIDENVFSPTALGSPFDSQFTEFFDLSNLSGSDNFLLEPRDELE